MLGVKEEKLWLFSKSLGPLWASGRLGLGYGKKRRKMGKSLVGNSAKGRLGRVPTYFQVPLKRLCPCPLGRRRAPGCSVGACVEDLERGNNELWREMLPEELRNHETSPSDGSGLVSSLVSWLKDPMAAGTCGLWPCVPGGTQPWPGLS